MSSKVNIGNQQFNYPNNGENPSWGEDASDAFIELVNQVNIVAGGLATGNLALAAQTSFTDIPGFIFNYLSTTTAKVEYVITLVSPSGSYATYEEGVLNFTHGNGVWNMTRTFGGSGCGFLFNVTTAGQVQYKTEPTYASCTFKYKTIGVL